MGIKQSIISNLLEIKFGENPFDVFTLESQKLADELYFEYYGKDTVAKIEALPDGWLPESEGVTVNIYGSTFCGKYSKKRRVLQENVGYNRNTTFTVASDDDSPNDTWECSKELAKSFYDNRAKENQTREEYTSLKQKAQRIVNGCKWDTELITKWPEIKELVQKVCEDDVSGVVLEKVDMKELNKSFGLDKK